MHSILQGEFRLRAESWQRAFSPVSVNQCVQLGSVLSQLAGISCWLSVGNSWQSRISEQPFGSVLKPPNLWSTVPDEVLDSGVVTMHYILFPVLVS